MNKNDATNATNATNARNFRNGRKHIVESSVDHIVEYMKCSMYMVDALGNIYGTEWNKDTYIKDVLLKVWKDLEEFGQ